MASTGLGLDVAAIAQTILAGIREHYAAAAGAGLPARQVIAGGNPRLVAWDACEQLVVTLSGIGIGPAPGIGDTAKSVGNQISSAGLRHAVFAIQITRANPESHDGSTPPHPDVQTAAALAFMQDAGMLSQALVAVCAKVAGALQAGDRVRPGAVECLGPEGGFVCSEGSIAVTVGSLI